MKNINKIVLILILALFSFAPGAEIKEILVNADAELHGIILLFDSYEIEIDPYGKIRRIDLVYGTSNIDDYTFWYGKVQYKGREEFYGQRRPHQTAFTKVKFNDKGNLFINEKKGSNVKPPNYLGIEHKDRTRIDYHFEYKSKLRKLDNLSFDYEPAFKRLRRIGDVEFLYKDEEQKHDISNSLQLAKIGHYTFNTYRDFKISRSPVKKNGSDFAIRVIYVY